MRRAFAILIAAIAAAALPACGDDPAPVKTTIAASDFSDPEAGIAFRAPAGARIGKGEQEQVVVLRRGKSTLVISRFKRPGENLPNAKKEYERAARALEREYIEPDSASPEAVASNIAQIADHDAVVVTTVSDGKTVEHIHFYEYDAEIVTDMVTPTSDLKAAQARLFDPVLSSLEITKPQD